MSGLAVLPGGLVLLCAFALLGRPAAAMPGIYRRQALIVGLAAFCRGVAGHSAALLLLGLVVAAEAFVLPVVLRKLGRSDPAPADRPSPRPSPAGLALPLGLAVAGIALGAVLPAGRAAAMDPARAGLALAFAAMLLGLLVTAIRREKLARLTGLLAAGNGLMLALPGLPFAAGFALVLPLVLIGPAAGLPVEREF